MNEHLRAELIRIVKKYFPSSTVYFKSKRVVSVFWVKNITDKEIEIDEQIIAIIRNSIDEKKIKNNKTGIQYFNEAVLADDYIRITTENDTSRIELFSDKIISTELKNKIYNEVINYLQKNEYELIQVIY